ARGIADDKPGKVSSSSSYSGRINGRPPWVGVADEMVEPPSPEGPYGRVFFTRGKENKARVVGGGGSGTGPGPGPGLGSRPGMVTLRRITSPPQSLHHASRDLEDPLGCPGALEQMPPSPDQGAQTWGDHRPEQQLHLPLRHMTSSPINFQPENPSPREALGSSLL
ncbi:unnamed protein product, partial [Discosporangium mesarthrocarpum]